MTSASSASRTLLPILAIAAGVGCVQGGCSFRSLDYLGNGHAQGGAAMDSAERDVAAPATPGLDSAIVDMLGRDTLVEDGSGDGLAAEAPGEGEKPDSGSAVGGVDGTEDRRVSGAGGTGGDNEVGLVTGGSGAGGARTEIGGAGGMGGADGGADDAPAGSDGAGSGGTPASGGIGGSGAVASGGTAASGGNGTGGAVAAGGAAATGGKPAAGGAFGSGGATAACGTTKSTFSETFKFNTSVSPLELHTTPSDATMFTFSTTGPASNTSLCSKGCAVLSVHFIDNQAAFSGTAVMQTFSAPVNLTGATIAFSYAIDNPAQVPVQVQVFATGDAPGWLWGAPTTVGGTGLATYSPPTGFAAQTLSPVDDPDGFCASATKVLGLQVQNTKTINSTTTGTVTIYIASLGITVP